MKKIYIMIYLSLFICTFQLQAKVFHVSTSDQLQDALNMFSGNRDASDTIYLAAGEYRVSYCLNSIRIIENEVNEINIRPEEGLRADQVILNVDEFSFDTDHTDYKILIQGITIQNAKTNAIYVEGVKETEIRNCIIKGNDYGIYINNSNIIISGNTLYSNNTGMRIESCSENSEVTSNLIFNNGGAIYACGNKVESLAIKSNIICNNEKGIYLRFFNNAFISNNLIFENGSYSGNPSIGGIYIETSRVQIINNTITKNTSSNGGGIRFQNWQGGHIIKVSNNIFWNNYSYSKGDDIYINTYANFIGFYNNIYNDLEGPVDELVANSKKDPLFIDPQNDDYQLSPDSPCINAGDNTAPNQPETDLDGNPRINDTIIDIGAYEFSTTQRIPSDQNEDWILTNEEFNAYAEAWRKGEPWNSGPDPIPIDYVTRSGYLQKKGETYKNEGGKKPECWKPDDNNTKR
jgi:parallel beta-helix repeat protein